MNRSYGSANRGGNFGSYDSGNRGGGNYDSGNRGGGSYDSGNRGGGYDNRGGGYDNAYHGGSGGYDAGSRGGYGHDNRGYGARQSYGGGGAGRFDGSNRNEGGGSFGGPGRFNSEGGQHRPDSYNRRDEFSGDGGGGYNNNRSAMRASPQSEVEKPRGFPNFRGRSIQATIDKPIQVFDEVSECDTANSQTDAPHSALTAEETKRLESFAHYEDSNNNTVVAKPTPPSVADEKDSVATSKKEFTPAVQEPVAIETTPVSSAVPEEKNRSESSAALHEDSSRSDISKAKLSPEVVVNAVAPTFQDELAKNPPVAVSATHKSSVVTEVAKPSEGVDRREESGAKALLSPAEIVKNIVAPKIAENISSKIVEKLDASTVVSELLHAGIETKPNAEFFNRLAAVSSKFRAAFDELDDLFQSLRH